jgi:hypothetical protein
MSEPVDRPFPTAFLGPGEEFRAKVGLLMFEFSHFYASDFARGRDFVEALDKFLGQLPSDWSYGVEMRNKHFLHTEYSRCSGVTGSPTYSIAGPTCIQQILPRISAFIKIDVLHLRSR